MIAMLIPLLLSTFPQNDPQPAKGWTHTPNVTPKQGPPEGQIQIVVTGPDIKPPKELPAVYFAVGDDLDRKRAFRVPYKNVELLEADLRKIVLQVRVPSREDIFRNLPEEKQDPRLTLLVDVDSAQVPPAGFYITRKSTAALLAAVVLAVILLLGSVGTMVARRGWNPLQFMLGLKGNSYSLTLFQISFWTLVITFATVYVWVLTDTVFPLNSTALLLLGITSATHLASKLKATGAPAETKRQPAAADADRKAHLRDLVCELVGGKQRPSIFKLQMLVWTLIIGMMMLTSAIGQYRFLELDQTYLTLIGISNGVYVGNKYVATPEAPAK